jgi:hypothetical protein
MNDSFVKNFMYTAKKVTHTERCIAVDRNLEPIAMVNVDRAMLETTAFGEFAMECLREARDNNDVVITNNVITDPSEAPTTNTNFANLRVVVVMPVGNYGIIYLDQHIRKGVIPKQMIERLKRLAEHIIENNLEKGTTEEFYEMFQTVKS